MWHLFFLSRASLGVLKCPQGVRDGLWRPWGGVFRNFRFAILRMAAVLTTKSFFMVKSGAIRNGLFDRCLPMFF